MPNYPIQPPEDLAVDLVQRLREMLRISLIVTARFA